MEGSGNAPCPKAQKSERFVQWIAPGICIGVGGTMANSSDEQKQQKKPLVKRHPLMMFVAGFIVGIVIVLIISEMVG